MENVIIRRTDVDSSLCSFVVTSLLMLYGARQENKKAYIDLSRPHSPEPYRDDEAFKRCGNMWNWYFTQPDKVPEFLYWQQPNEALSNLDDCEVWTWGYQKHAGIPLEQTSDFFRKTLQFQPEVEHRARQLLKKYALDPAKMLAISHRKTDKTIMIPPPCQIESYFPMIDNLLEQEPDLKLFAKVEEKSTSETLLRRYPQMIEMQEFYYAPTSQHMMDRVSPVSGYERGIQAVMMLWLFAQSKYLIKNNANLSYLAGLLSAGTVYHVHQDGSVVEDITRLEALRLEESTAPNA